MSVLICTILITSVNVSVHRSACGTRPRAPSKMCRAAYRQCCPLVHGLPCHSTALAAARPAQIPASLRVASSPAFPAGPAVEAHITVCHLGTQHINILGCSKAPERPQWRDCGLPRWGAGRACKTGCPPCHCHRSRRGCVCPPARCPTPPSAPPARRAPMLRTKFLLF